MKHHVVGETSVGHPYSGFISVSSCANVTLRNCFATAHKTYRTIGAAGKPVSMGSYDYSASSVVNFTMINCRMDDINDRSRWGVIGTNFCKNILLEDCVLNRMDAHMGVSGSYIIRRCTLGHAGLNAIGRGLLLVEDSTLHGGSLISLRSDYGSTWEGEVVIRNCRWIPAAGRTITPQMFTCATTARTISATTASCPGGDDRRTPCGRFESPEWLQGMYLFSDPGGSDPADSPFPYRRCQKVKISGLSTASGKKPRISPNTQLTKRVTVSFEEPKPRRFPEGESRYDMCDEVPHRFQ